MMYHLHNQYEQLNPVVDKKQLMVIICILWKLVNKEWLKSGTLFYLRRELSHTTSTGSFWKTTDLKDSHTLNYYNNAF